MQKAIYLSSDSDLKISGKGYSRLYYGAEFCEHLLPSKKQLRKAFDYACEQKMSFTFVAPYVTDKGLKKVQLLFDELQSCNGKKIEVVVNDFGVLRLLRRIYPDFVPVLGRLLTRQRRGLGFHGLDEVPPGLVEVFQKTAVEDPDVVEFLNSQGVLRVEIDNLLQGVGSDFSRTNLKASIYTPYGFLTTTRYCPWTYNGKSWINIKDNCAKSCWGNFLTLNCPGQKQPILMRGNTQFYKNDKLDDISNKGIDRIVFEPELPA